MSRLPTPSSRLPVAGASRLTAVSGVARATPRVGTTSAAGSTLKRQGSQLTMTAKRGRMDTSGSESRAAPVWERHPVMLQVVKRWPLVWARRDTTLVAEMMYGR